MVDHQELMTETRQTVLRQRERKQIYHPWNYCDFMGISERNASASSSQRNSKGLPSVITQHGRTEYNILCPGHTAFFFFLWDQSANIFEVTQHFTEIQIDVDTFEH